MQRFRASKAIQVCVGLALLALSATISSAAAAQISGPAIRIAPLDSGSSLALHDIRGSAHIVMFWRTDCAPCMIELHSLRALQLAAGRERVLIVALEDPQSARRTLAHYNIPMRNAFIGLGEPGAILSTASNGGRALPLSIALDSRGEICRRHTGLLGTDRARSWIAQCSR